MANKANPTTAERGEFVAWPSLGLLRRCHSKGGTHLGMQVPPTS